jgi:hypothetical protein
MYCALHSFHPASLRALQLLCSLCSGWLAKQEDVAPWNSARLLYTEVVFVFDGRATWKCVRYTAVFDCSAGRGLPLRFVARIRRYK